MDLRAHLTDPSRSILEPHIPAWKWMRISIFDAAVWQWLGMVVAIAGSYVAARLLTWVSMRLLTRLTARTTATWDDALVQALRRPSRFFFGVLTFRALVLLLSLPEGIAYVVSRIVGTISIATVVWAAMAAGDVVATVLETHATKESNDSSGAELRARGITTQIHVFRRIFNVALSLLAGALILVQFEVVRNVGVSLLASAGIAGVVIGFAAQRTIGNLFAGLQLSITQPIRMGDVVIVEGEWGTIEEITLTYVVVRIWDERRLVVPMVRFLEEPFQNWTKVSPQLHGTVFLNVDWSLPVDEMRRELERVVRDSPNWDGRTAVVQVTDAKERVLELRVLVSAKNSGALWGLRVHVREHLVKWLREYEGGRFLPQSRVVDLTAEGRSTRGGSPTARHLPSTS